MSNLHPLTVAKITVAIALLLALAPWPYAYYMFLRAIVFFVFGYYAIQHWQAFERAKKSTAWWVWALGATALLFNPFFPAHLTREIWSVFNVAAALLLLATIHWEKSV